MKKSSLSMIDLTRKYENVPCAAPAAPEGTYAPMIYLDDVKGIEAFPEEGTMVVKFKRKSLSVSSTEGGTRVSLSLEIPCICEVMPEKMKEDKAEDVLDKLLEEAAKEMKGSEEDED